MKIIITLGFVFFIIQNLFAQDVAPKPVYDNVTITLTGKIYDGLTNKPIPGAVVRIDAANTGAHL